MIIFDGVVLEIYYVLQIPVTTGVFELLTSLRIMW